MSKTAPAAIAMLAVITACVYQQHGNRFDVAAINQLRPGASTEQDAVALLGKPTATSAPENGGHVLQWYFVYGTALGTGGGAHAAILFGPDGKMVRVTHLFQQ
jgi:outer membrane protein assembly factor BamE (lipoprotein component of BamABCDE complex)